MPEGSITTSSDVSMGEGSHRLSTTSISSNECMRLATPSGFSDLPSDLRLVSLISTLSSADDRPPVTLPPPQSNKSPDVEPDAHPGGHCEGAEPRPPTNRKGFSYCPYHSNNNKKEWMVSQASRRRHTTSMPRSMAPPPQLTYLDHVVMEIIETERTYVRDLRMIVEDYLAHIIDCSDLSIRPEQVCLLFGNIEDIYEFNSELLQDLDHCDHDPVAVARCFVMKSEYFNIYTQYCTNYPNSVAALTECMRSKPLAKFFRDRQAQLKCSLPLGSYLLKPVQRILKYHLLLQEIAKHFDPEEEGYEVVEEAIYTMTGVAWYINDMKRKHEHAVRVQEVQSLLLNWKGNDLTMYGELVLEGNFKVHRVKNERTLFLFDRMLLITKRRGEHFIYKAHISCSTLMLIENAKDSLSFSVTHYKHPKQPHTLQAKSAEEKKLWSHHIKRLILENHHAVIPQKAKDAILEMDSLYPPRCRPERRRKATPPQPDDGCREQRPLDVCPDDDVASLESIKENGGGPEKGVNGKGRTKLSAVELLQEITSKSGLIENLEPDSADLELATVSGFAPRLEELKPGSVPPVDPLSATPDSDSKTLSSAESSEDEEEDRDESEKEDQAARILPSSVLDKSDSIAQHFKNSIKRSGATLDDSRSLSCSPPQLLSRPDGSLSLEPVDPPPAFTDLSSDPVENFGAKDLTLLSLQDDSLFDPDRSLQKRRDSILSKQEQLLIGKIKSYYENAESQDATFSLQRRESLSYIPTGLVHSSVTRFNSIPKENPVPSNPSASTTCSNGYLPLVESDARGHMVSSDLLEALESDLRRSDQENPGKCLGPHIQQKSPSEEQEFRPSSDMIEVCQAMERKITRSFGEDGDCETLGSSGAINDVTEIADKRSKSKTSNLTSTTKDSIILTQYMVKSSSLTCKGSLKALGKESFVFQAPNPRVNQLKVESEWERRLDDSSTDPSKSKVLHLARQYSQRIKTTKPIRRQQSQGALISRSLSCVVEESERTVKTNFALALDSSSDLLTPSDLTQPHTCFVDVVSPATGRGDHGPLTPPAPPIEGFDWPDVRELRSKYSEQTSPVGPSSSIPDQMLDLQLRSSCSSSHVLTQEPLHRTHGGLDTGSDEHRKHLQRANSLDPRLSGSQLTELQKLLDNVTDNICDGYFVAAETILPHDPEHKITVLDKVPEPQPEELAETSRKEEEQEELNYVEIRSPTSREKISIMAVVERCRAYQESDPYKHREPVNSASSTNHEQEPKKTNIGERLEAGHQSIVKNLREKFQNLS